MAEMSLQIEKISGQSGGGRACEVFTSRISLVDGNLATIVSCILVKDAKSSDLQIFVRDIFEIFTKKIEGAQGGILDALRLAGDACREYIKTRNLDASFVHVLFYKNACYIARYGNEVKVWVYEPEKSEEITFEYGSGLPAFGQIYLVATNKFVSTFDIAAILQSADVDLGEVMDGLATDISAASDQSEIGAALIMVKGEKAKSEMFEAASETGKEEAAGGEPLPEGQEVKAGRGDEEIVSSKKDADYLEDKEKKSGIATAGVLLIKRELLRLKKGDIRAIFRLRRSLFILGLVIIIILGLSAFFKIGDARDKEKLAQFNSHLAAASTSYSEAGAIIDLNRVHARDILAKADGEIKLALALVPDDERAKKLASDISAKLKETESLTGVNFSEVANVDLSLVSLSSLGKGQLAGVGSGTIFKVDIKSKSVDKINSVEGAKAGLVFDSGAFILSGGNVFKVDIGSGKQEKVIEGQDGSDLAVFLGNVYILSQSGINKFVPVDKGYTQSENYLERAQSFSESSHFAIDGSIWVTDGSQILKYTRGKRDEFTISGLGGSNSQFGEIYTDANLDNLYVVDVANSALLVIGKDGVYKKAYQSPDFGKASALVVDEGAGKMYVSVDNKILEAEL